MVMTRVLLTAIETWGQTGTTTFLRLDKKNISTLLIYFDFINETPREIKLVITEEPFMKSTESETRFTVSMSLMACEILLVFLQDSCS